MAEVEMELDVSTQVGQGDPIDEDLIDYDTDEETRPSDQNLMSLDLKEDVDHQMQDPAQDGLQASGHDDEAMGMTESIGDHVDSSVHDMIDFAAEPATEGLDILVNDVEEEEGGEGGGGGGGDGHINDANRVEDADVNGDHLPAEPDALNPTETEDTKETTFTGLESYEIDEAPDIPSELGKAADTRDAADTSTAAVTDKLDDAKEDFEGAKEKKDEDEDVEEEDEITWEEENVATQEDDHPAEDDGKEEPVTGSNDSTAHQNNDQQYSAAQEEVITKAEGDSTEAAPEEPPETNDQEAKEPLVNGLNGSADQTSHVHSEVNPEFPSISVHYRGEDYPLFSQDVNGFFSDVAIMEYSINALLGSLRTELQDEIEALDDLVLQIDELGLEFVEAKSENDQSALTLRQILEVFELLVKNQDPDSTRTLYTYLTTRPNVSRRYEFLVDSATEGKGLDELVRLFEPAAVAAASHGIAENMTEDEQEHDVSDGTEEHYEGNAELGGPNQDREYAAEDSAIGQDDVEEEAEDVQSQPADAGAPKASPNLQNSHASVEEEEEEEEYPEAIDQNGPQVSQDEEEYDFGDEASEHGHHADTQADEIDYEDADVASESLHNTVVPEESNLSSTSHTVQDGSEEGPVSILAAGEDDGLDASAAVEQDKDEDEIDWLEEPEVVSEAVASTPSAGEKRGRDEIEAGVVDEQDVKRLRS